MFFLEPSRTPYDLNFRLGDIPVRVHPFFWLMAAVLGWGVTMQAPGEDIGVRVGSLLVWVACVFVSILVHELGHILMGRAFGDRGHIVLYTFGGLAVGSYNQPARWKRIAVSFAGPLAGFVLFGVTLAVAFTLLKPWLVGLRVGWLIPYYFFPQEEEPGVTARYLQFATNALIEINLLWGLINLLPVWPLDGGQISREIFTGLMPRHGLRVSLGISMLTAGVLAVNGLAEEFWHKPIIPGFHTGGLYTAILFGSLALSSFGMLQQLPQGPVRQRQAWDRDDEARAPWERDPDYWKKGSDPWNE